METADALGQFGGVAGLIAATTAATQVFKTMLRRVPVPPMAFVLGELLTIASWRVGLLDVGIAPVGASGWEWFIVGVWGLPIVLGAMGAASIGQAPRAVVKRGGDGE